MSTTTGAAQTYRLPNQWIMIPYAVIVLSEGAALILHMMSYYSDLESYQACLKAPNVIPAFCEPLNPNNISHVLIVVGAAVAMAGSLFVMYYTRRVRLVISSEGVMYDSGLLFRIRTPWSNLAGIYRLRAGAQEHLLLREPGLEASPLTAWIAGPKARRLIPLGQFDRRWRTGALGEDIRRFAPQLLDQEVITTIS